MKCHGTMETLRVLASGARSRGRSFLFGTTTVAILILVSRASAAPVAPSRVTTHDIVAEVDLTQYEYNLDDLLYTHPGDDRGFGPEHDLARENINDHFQSLDLQVTLEPFIWNHLEYYNVVAMKPGTVTPEQHYIVGAHYDSQHNPGADDNGSGTAAIMEIARVLSQHDFEATVIFIAFDREEQMLSGSTAYVSDHAGDDIRGMISLDMIAYNHNDTNEVLIYGHEASDSVKQSLAQAVAQYSGGLGVLIEQSFDWSDHAPFEAQGFPACLIIEGGFWDNPHYHQATDNVETPGYIDYEYAVKITKSVAGWMADAAGRIGVGCDGDVDRDGDVGFADLTQLLSAWGTCAMLCPEDLDGDDSVGFADLTRLLNHWGPC